jgi:hypothetical protein
MFEKPGLFFNHRMRASLLGSIPSLLAVKDPGEAPSGANSQAEQASPSPQLHVTLMGRGMRVFIAAAIVQVEEHCRARRSICFTFISFRPTVSMRPCREEYLGCGLACT